MKTTLLHTSKRNCFEISYNGDGKGDDMEGNKEIINKIVQRIVGHHHPDKIILFGSHAKGEGGPDSDIDLLIVFTNVESRRRKAVEIYSLLAGIGVPKDIVVVTKDDIKKYGHEIGTIIKPALDEGKVIYERAA